MPYNDYRTLARNEQIGRDYEIEARPGLSGVLVMAPHGGRIEPGTTAIAFAIAGGNHGFYSFTGTRPQGNRRLRIPSTAFDEPVGLAMVQQSRWALVIHGCAETDRAVFVGGRDRLQADVVMASLQSAGFNAVRSSRFPGLHPQNICNRTTRHAGVQLELSAGLRSAMGVMTPTGPPNRRSPLERNFVDTLRTAIDRSIAASAPPAGGSGG